MNKTIKREKFLRNNGFNHVYHDYKNDRDCSWWEKKIKIGEFKGKMVTDGRFHYIEILTLNDFFKNPTHNYIWKGSWKQFVKKVKKY